MVIFSPALGGKLDVRGSILTGQVTPGSTPRVGRPGCSTLPVGISSLASVGGRIASVSCGAARSNATGLLGAVIEDTKKITIGVGPFVVVVFIVGSIDSKVGAIFPATGVLSSELVIYQGGGVGDGRRFVGEMTGLGIF